MNDAWDPFQGPGVEQADFVVVYWDAWIKKKKNGCIVNYTSNICFSYSDQSESKSLINTR